MPFSLSTGSVIMIAISAATRPASAIAKTVGTPSAFAPTA